MMNHHTLKRRADDAAKDAYNEAYAGAIEAGHGHMKADRIASSAAEEAHGDYYDGLGDWQRDQREDR